MSDRNNNKNYKTSIHYPQLTNGMLSKIINLVTFYLHPL